MTAQTTLTVASSVHFNRRKAGRKELKAGEAPPPPPPRVPRVAKLMALAIRFDRLVQEGKIRDHAQLARLGHVSRARISQIMNLLHLAPDIQERLLFLPPVDCGRAPIKLADLQSMAMTQVWQEQRRRWTEVVSGSARKGIGLA